jgi:pimeloyl-ACP methyl ester carboxylesterase
VELVRPDGVHLACRIDGSGWTVLMTHGYGDSQQSFAGVRDALVVEARVVTWDLRGHGASGAPDDPQLYSVRATLADMEALLDAAGAERAVLVGHSLGGYLSLAFRLASPRRVAGLVLVGTGPGFRREEGRTGWNEMTERLADAARTRGLALAARGILPQRDSSVIDSLPDIEVPTAVVVGDRDEQFLAGSRYMADRIPGASLVVVEGAAHSPHVSHPDSVATAVRGVVESASV